MLPQEWNLHNLHFPFPPHFPYLFKTFVCYFCLYQAILTTETRFFNTQELGSLSSWWHRFSRDSQNHPSYFRAPCCGSSWCSGGHPGWWKEHQTAMTVHSPILTLPNQTHLISMNFGFHVALTRILNSSKSQLLVLTCLKIFSVFLIF